MLDCGLLHSFDSAERREYVRSVASVTAPGGRLHVLCFGDAGPDPGPHPVSDQEVRAAFTDGSGWSVASVSPDRVETRFHAHGAPASLACVERV